MLTIADIMATMGLHTNSVWLVEPTRWQQMMARRQGVRPLQRPASVEPRRQGGVAIVDVKGILVPEALWSDEIDSGMLAETLQALRAMDDVSCVVLNIDCPGGVAMGMTDLISAATELNEKKPVVAFAKFLATSAAYWLSVTAREIIAGPDAIVGSVGTRILLYDYSKLFAEAGVEAVAIDTGKFKSMGAFGTALTEDHRQFLQDWVDESQTSFADAVQNQRQLSDEEMATVSEAAFYRSRQALEMRLIDDVGSLSLAIERAVAMVPRTISPKARSKQMSDTAIEVATLPELKKALPKASNDFLIQQMENEATVADATRAWSNHLSEQNEKLEAEKAEAEKRAADAEAKAEKAAATAPPPTKKKGNQATTTEVEDEQTTGDVDYAQMARSLAKEKNWSYRKACMAIKKQYPESRAAFFGPILDG